MLAYAELCPDLNGAILDVGSGEGTTVRQLVDFGFRNALGIDLFIPQDAYYQGRLLVKKQDFFTFDGRFDVVSLNHSLEHIADQPAALAQIAKLLNPGGSAMIRVPVFGGEAWEAYGENWVQLDAPRHLYLHTPRSLQIVAQGAGLRMTGFRYNSSGFQFWGSEVYRRGLPLEIGKPPFSRHELASFDRRADLANRWNRGDQILAVFQHVV